MPQDHIEQEELEVNKKEGIASDRVRHIDRGPSKKVEVLLFTLLGPHYRLKGRRTYHAPGSRYGTKNKDGGSCREGRS